MEAAGVLQGVQGEAEELYGGGSGRVYAERSAVRCERGDERFHRELLRHSDEVIEFHGGTVPGFSDGDSEGVPG